MNDYGHIYYDIETVGLDYEYIVTESHVETLKQLMEEYDKVSMEDWFEDEQIVEKKIPEFNFV
jgi:hypothetical protein